MSVRFSFKRSGEIIATPRLTFATAGVPAETRATYLKAINASLAACVPLKFTGGLGGASPAGRSRSAMSIIAIWASSRRSRDVIVIPGRAKARTRNPKLFSESRPSRDSGFAQSGDRPGMTEGFRIAAQPQKCYPKRKTVPATEETSWDYR